MTPQDDFYSHINDEWLKSTVIPSDQNRWGTFNELNDSNYDKLRELFSSLNSSLDNDEKNLHILHNQYFTENKHINHVKEYIKLFQIVKSKEGLRNLIFELFTLNGISGPVNYFVYSDFNDSDTNILHIGTGGLGLPDRDYYFMENKREQREEYKRFMKRYLDLFGLKYNVDDIYRIEERFAEFTYTSVQKRDTKLMNNMSNIDIIENNYPELNVRHFFKHYGVEPERINLINPTFLQHFCELWRSVDLEHLKQYYLFMFLRKLGSYISTETETELFNFYSKYLSGTEIMKPLWKRSIMLCENMLGMVVGKMFVKHYFSEDNKKQVEDMIVFIKEELKKRLIQNDWMEDVTKGLALQKLDKMNFKIGYPEVWRDFSKLKLNINDTLVVNVLNCYRFENDFDNSFLYKQKDNTLWFMSPHEVNAYYSPSYNEIVFPAGILMEPFFFNNDMARSFGGIGAVIGHEITHGFDDKGREYDSDGNFNDWWTEADATKYKERTDKLRNQFDNLMIEGHKVNGSLTLGENIADLGGVSISYYAMMNYFDDNLTENNKRHFFENYATVWKCKTRPEETIKRLATDPHSPPCFRVNQILSNFVDFYKVYNVTEGNKLYLPEVERAVIW